MGCSDRKAKEIGKKLAVIGASYLQAPLIQKAKYMGLETHVFAWAADDVGEKLADHFYPISIVEKEEILQKCREIGIDGICSIGSDLAVIAVNFVADCMGLVGNSMDCTERSTNKHKMRLCFEANGDPSPKSRLIETLQDLEREQWSFPVIVKPTDRSGSRGITKLEGPKGLKEAVRQAWELSFEKRALVEEYADGQEYSVECISVKGVHQLLAVTKKYTTGSPHFIETAHLEPAPLSDEMRERIRAVTFHALDSLGIRNGASHSEIKVSEDGKIVLIEVGGRMGGDCIGSDLVELSTGVDYVRAVIDVAMGREPQLTRGKEQAAAVRFVLSREDIRILERVKREHPEILVKEDATPLSEKPVVDSSSRYGYYILKGGSRELLEKYLQ